MSKSSIQSVVVLTGAGISAESGIKTFRDSNGLWENHPVEEVASPAGFAKNPELVHRFYNLRRQQLIHGGIKPNSAHLALAELEDKFPGRFLLVTQNVDNLHERAGSKNIIHMHGEILKMQCAASGRIFSNDGDIAVEDLCECCNQPSRLRPRIVWFGETPLQMEEIYQALVGCDLFVSIGTSGHVYPAAGFAQVAREAGAHNVEINLEPSAVQSNFNEQIYGPAGVMVPAFVSRLIESEVLE